MSINVIICGAAGRMGKLLVSLVHENPEMRLVGAVEAAKHWALGKDAGEVAGIGPIGVEVTADYGALATPETVTLDFTLPEAALAHLRMAVAKGAAIVIGTTGFSAEQRAEAERIAPQTRTLIAPNMSVGVNVLLKVVEEVARILQDGFDPEIMEIHHRFKIDAPSGTALALGRAIAAAQGKDFDRQAKLARQGITGQRTNDEIGIVALRGGDVVGDHTVVFAGFAERLEFTHRAQSRECLARGALRAARWLPQQKPGLYAMKDVLGL
ncbi:MAG TPA: 4-hydroxy-tetrahydrodipicolinate reductase [Methylomirabilota bacterium]|jgi:4-hydroxy-tetrahydrodipicolinate reductase|nr:4-hydroxy-tetrahydrodipicolinate reductase [Methylomirabilota bacterium]